MAYPRGQPKTGGRTKGSLNKKDHALRVNAKYNGMSPLELMVLCMQEAFTAGDKDKGFLYAKDIAPYVHPKLASIDQRTESSLVIEVKTFLLGVQHADDTALLQSITSSIIE